MGQEEPYPGNPTHHLQRPERHRLPVTTVTAFSVIIGIVTAGTGSTFSVIPGIVTAGTGSNGFVIGVITGQKSG